MYPIGETKLLQLKGQPNIGEIHIKPPNGFEWLISLLYGFHTNVANSVGAWLIHNGPYPEVENFAEETTGTYEKSWFLPASTVTQAGMPIRLTSNFWVRYAVSLEAGKNIQVGGIILERPENLELLLRDWYAELVGRPIPALEGIKNRYEYYRGGI